MKCCSRGFIGKLHDPSDTQFINHFVKCCECLDSLWSRGDLQIAMLINNSFFFFFFNFTASTHFCEISVFIAYYFVVPCLIVEVIQVWSGGELSLWIANSQSAAMTAALTVAGHRGARDWPASVEVDSSFSRPCGFGLIQWL